MKVVDVEQRFVTYGERRGRILTSMNLPHFYVRDEKLEYLVCRQPEGDFTIHQINFHGNVGYCGEVITFLMDDGDLVEVKDPYPCDELFEHRTADRLARILDRPEIARKAFRIEVGIDLAVPSKEPAVIYEEPSFILDDWRYRVRTAWAGMDIRVHARLGSACMKVDDVLAMDYQRKHNSKICDLCCPPKLRQIDLIDRFST